MIKDLREIGFYTLSDARAASASTTSPLKRCELIVTGRCNFRCPYCRHIGGPDLDYYKAKDILRSWADGMLEAVRFSGGEPTLWPYLAKLCRFAQRLGAAYIAVSTNGSAKPEYYQHLILNGVNDFSVSLDACCAEDGDRMAGGIKGSWEQVVDNIFFLAQRAYTTVGVVLTEQNADKINDIVKFADTLGVHDIRIIPAAQNGDRLKSIHVDPDLLAKYPILKYRVGNFQAGQPVRGLSITDSHRCGLVLDDMAVLGEMHYPCIIYLREGGQPIGKVGPGMREERREWSETHDVYHDPICSKNCLDVCVAYNNKFRELNPCSSESNLVTLTGSSGESVRPSMCLACSAEPIASLLTQISSKLPR
jgi:MoaA/NifB/PqqE/SkfB family radical SAM enzyme